MNEILIAFITGLTTGGLSCLAVQGGLLASSVAQQVELDLQKTGHRKNARPPTRASQPILLFLTAKLVAYTLLGFLLGALGSVLQLTPLWRAILQIAIGIFMLGTALRLLNVHPIFRYFALEPPATLTRYIRRTAKAGTPVVTPLFLGALTVLIPCGVTQAMMAVAIGTGNPLMGAALLFSFILGTSPVFFIVAYLTTRLGSKLEANFLRVVAVLVFVLGIFSIDTGLNLLGSPYSLTALARAFTPDATAAPTETTPLALPRIPTPGGATQPASAVLTINVTNGGYTPNKLIAKAGVPIQLELVTNKTASCSRAFVIPTLDIQEMLPATGTVMVTIPAQAAGTVLHFSCSMGMYTGQIEFQN